MEKKKHQYKKRPLTQLPLNHLTHDIASTASWLLVPLNWVAGCSFRGVSQLKTMNKGITEHILPFLRVFPMFTWVLLQLVSNKSWPIGTLLNMPIFLVLDCEAYQTTLVQNSEDLRHDTTTRGMKCSIPKQGYPIHENNIKYNFGQMHVKVWSHQH